MKRRVIKVGDTSGNWVAQLESNECDATVTRAINRQWVLTMRYPVPEIIALDKSVYFIADAWIQVVDVDNYSDTTSFIVTRVGSERRQDGVIIYNITAEHHSIITLSQEIINDHIEFKGETPTNILTKLMSYSTYGVSTVNPSSPVDMTVSFETVLKSIQKLAKICSCYYNAIETRNIQLLTNIGSDNYVRITPEINMQSIRVVNHTSEIRNKIYGVGGGEKITTIGGAPHIVDSISTNTITCKSNKVVFENDVWNTNYAIKFLTGALAGNSYQIIDCVAGVSQDTITVGSSMAAVIEWDLFFIHTNGTPADLTDFIFSGSANKEATYLNPQWQDTTNLLKYGTMEGRSYPAGLCEGWTEEGSINKAENTNTDYLIYGQKSQRIWAASDAEGIKQTITHKQPGEVWSIFANVYIVSGSVMLGFESNKSGFANVANQTGQWVTISIENKLISGNTVDVYILAATTTSEFYVDSVQAVIGKIGGRFCNPSEKKSLWNETYDQLDTLSIGRITYACKFADLYHLDNAKYPFYEVNLGDTVRIIDDDLNINSELTIVEQRNIIYQPEKMESIISNE